VVNQTGILKSSCISLHTDTYRAFVGEKEVNLTPTEFNLLACLLKNTGITLSRAILLERCGMNPIEGNVRTVDTHIHLLRSKLGKAGYLIRTVRGVGYRLEK